MALPARKLTSVPSNPLPQGATKAFAERLLAKQETICVVGLGYVGLPLACHLGKSFKVVGFDINSARVTELNSGKDSTGEIEDTSLLKQDSLQFSSDLAQIAKCSLFIVAVPTPVDAFNRPDFSPLVSASKTIGKVMKKGATIVFESTVYPGVTEGICRETLEATSGLTYKKDFALGYSPERINPGDRVHTVDKIVKVVSGSDPDTTDLLAWVYGSVTEAGTFRAGSIAVAEAAKVTENIQRDVNIALMNELAKVYDSLDIPISQVLEAAGTKWNFLKFYPGLVGGHCIGVDPYYLIHISEKVKSPATLIATSRSVNESIPRFLATKTISSILKSGVSTTEVPLRIAILGAAFKENVPDTRNTKVADLANELERFGAKVFVVDHLADKENFSHEYHRTLTTFEELPQCHAIVIAVRHTEFERTFRSSTLKAKLTAPYVVIDFKSMLNAEEAKAAGLIVHRL